LRQNSTELNAVISFAREMDSLVVPEAESLGLTITKRSSSYLNVTGDLSSLYGFIYRTRYSSRVFLVLFDFEAKNPEDFTIQARKYAWDEVFGVECTLSVSGNLRKSKLKNPSYLSLCLKDGIVDYFQKAYGERPEIDSKSAEARISFFGEEETVTVCYDMSGESLFKRGYRKHLGEAALKETLAAALLNRAGWQDGDPRPLYDPFCGSGTLLIEAAMISCRIPAGYYRKKWGFQKWKHHNNVLWTSVKDSADSEMNIKGKTRYIGCEIDLRAMKAANENIEKSGLQNLIHIDRGDALQNTPRFSAELPQPGLIITNPPWGLRLEKNQSPDFFRDLCRHLAVHFPSWQLSLFLGEKADARGIPFKRNRINHFYNGAEKCRLQHYTAHIEERKIVIDPSMEQLVNRLKKILKAKKKWAKREQTDSYRLYDADLPEFNAAIDVYCGKYYHIQEYKAPAIIDESKTRKRLHQIVEAVKLTTECSNDSIFVKQRQKQKGEFQYTKAENSGNSYLARENNLMFLVNLTDYLDTGLFLDHRPLRQWIKDEASGKSFLNLFCYTGSVTAAAASGGCSGSVSVDTSATYLDWAEKNLRINKLLSPDHKFICSDSIDYLKECKEKFDIIYIDPPTFSNSKSRTRDFDVQRDHSELIRKAALLLNSGGVIYFSNNFRRFIMDEGIMTDFNVSDITGKSIPEDFSKKKIHKAFKISQQ